MYSRYICSQRMAGTVISTLVLIFLPLSVVQSHVRDVSVETTAGTFIGLREEVDVYEGKVTISKFLGIPYAEPPLGNLRFRKPVAKDPFTTPYKAQQFGNACLQVYLMFPESPTDSEDCLFLNIFKPEVTGEKNKLPVMIWIHGGGFLEGSSDKYTGDALAPNGPVIVVTLNYRLSVWGFLSTEDSVSPGNYGLWDQQLAIQWVHQHIEAFGGDPKRITIFGESAGGSSVIFQGLYPGNSGLFQRIIAESGNAVSPWALRPNPKRDALKLATQVGCESDDTAAMVECLRNISFAQLNDAINTLENWDYSMPFPFVPAVDDDFILDSPREVLGDQNNNRKQLLEVFYSYDLMIGFNSGEGASAFSPFVFKTDIDPENFLPNKSYFDKTVVPKIVTLAFGKDAPSVLNDVLIAEYTDWNDPENPESIREMVCNMLSDWLLLGNTYRTIQSHATGSDHSSYLFYFTILPYQSTFPRPSWSHSPMHFDELLYVFGNAMLKEGIVRELQSWEKTAAHNIMTMWTNFAETGNPNKPRDLGVDWLPYTATKHRYLEIANVVTFSKVKERLYERRAVVWNTILPKIYEAARHSTPNRYKETCTVDEECPP